VWRLPRSRDGPAGRLEHQIAGMPCRAERVQDRAVAVEVHRAYGMPSATAARRRSPRVSKVRGRSTSTTLTPASRPARATARTRPPNTRCPPLQLLEDEQVRLDRRSVTQVGAGDGLGHACDRAGPAWVRSGAGLPSPLRPRRSRGRSASRCGDELKRNGSVAVQRQCQPSARPCRRPMPGTAV
jgi:hypothetical protein